MLQTENEKSLDLELNVKDKTIIENPANTTDLNTLKWASFSLLIMQASGHAIVAKYSRIVPGPKYLPSTVVVCCEFLKLAVCLIAHFHYRKKNQNFLSILYYDGKF
jgi:hypothetical protein